MAIGRLQSELEKKEAVTAEIPPVGESVIGAGVFMTEA